MMNNFLFRFYGLLVLMMFVTINMSCIDSEKSNRQKGYSENEQLFDLVKISDANLNCKFVSQDDDFEAPVVLVNTEEGNNSVVIWEEGDKQDWTKGDYLVLEVYGDNDYSGVLTIDFFKGEDELSIYTQLGLLPRLKTKIVFPLSYLDGQRVHMSRFPRQLKATVWGNRLDTKEITKVRVRFGPYSKSDFNPNYKLASISIRKDEPEPYESIQEPIVDEFGQWKLKEWEGKIEDENELVESNQRLKQSVQSAKFPVEWSKYGGWKKLKFESTGFFRTHHDGRRWWLVDPEGYGFLSVGVDVIGKSAAGPIDGIEDLFSNLPEDVGSNIDFYQSNMARAFGSSWQEDWEIITSGLMKKLRMNTVGNWSDLNFAKRNKIPYVLAMSGFPSTEVLLYRDLPDVFSSEYQQNSIEFARQLEAYKNDPYLIGYFLSNEPGWALGDHNLAYEMFRTNEQSKTKDEFVSWIASQYGGDINAFNKAWNLSLEGFEELKTKVFNDYSSKKATSDFYEFSSIIVRKYIDLPCDEIEKIDNNHLNLGMRYAWLSSELLYMAGERFDVFSINGYGMNPPETEEITRRSGKPVLIGEFHHGAIDRALPATGITGVMTQQDRADAYRNYVEQGLARPELIGMHYFQWIDHPFTGRFDGENYNIGVVSLTNIPYPELSEAMTLTNERIYKVGSGMISPYKKEVQEIPTISY